MWPATSLSFPPSLPCLCTILSECVGEFTVCCNLIQNKVTQHNTESERCSSSASLRHKLKQKYSMSLYFFFFSSDSAFLCFQAGWKIKGGVCWSVYFVKKLNKFRFLLWGGCVSSQSERLSNKCTFVIFIIVETHQLQTHIITADCGSFFLLLQHIYLLLWQHTWIISGA